jgi:hypothetical protein
MEGISEGNDQDSLGQFDVRAARENGQTRRPARFHRMFQSTITNLNLSSNYSPIDLFALAKRQCARSSITLIGL